MEIIPKQRIIAPPWQRYLFYFSIALLIGLILSFFILGSFQKKSLILLENLKAEISKEKTPPNLALEREVKVLERKIKAFSQMAEKHPRVSTFLKELENLSHPRVWFSSLSLDSEGEKVTVSGVADSFFNLGQQLLIFDGSPKILTANLSRITIGKKGQIEFTFDLSLDPSIFK